VETSAKGCLEGEGKGYRKGKSFIAGLNRREGKQKSSMSIFFQF